MRLDEALVSRGLLESRSQAKRLIESGSVLVDGTPIKKPSTKVAADSQITLQDKPRFVSRGGEKLAAFLQAQSINPTNWNCLDVGASTGGFTDCLLQYGAAHVSCIDVGQGQLHPSLLKDPRVFNLEKTNAKAIPADLLPHPLYDAVVSDLSFISLTQVLESMWSFLKPGGLLIVLVKPQFELGKARMDACRGIVKDPALQEEALQSIKDFVLQKLPGAKILASMDSPILGGDGNREFLLGVLRSELDR